MKAKLLRKIRRKYELRWVKNDKDIMALSAIDHHNKKVVYYPSVKFLLIEWVSQNMSIFEMTNIYERWKKRENLIDYKKAIKTK